MIIADHAVEMYLDRVLGIDHRQAGESVLDFVYDQIEKTVRTPEMIYQDGDQIPIHIRNGCAVPRDEASGGSRGVIDVVPTVYDSGVWIKKFDSQKETASKALIEA